VNTDLKEAAMTVRRVLLLAGAVLLLAGIIALLVPVSASGGSGSVGCGNAVASDLSEAREKDNSNPGNIPIVGGVIQSIAPQTHTNYVSECNSALSMRRAWSIPLAVVGSLVVAGSFLVRDRATSR
jgi:hypothetical protein